MENEIEQAKDDYTKKKLGRRDFLRSLVVAGLSSSAALAALEAIDPNEAQAQFTTQAVGEEGGQGGRVITQAVGEEGGRGGRVTTYAVGEEGRRGAETTLALGEEDRIISSSKYGEGDGQFTTFALGEEDNIVVTQLEGEDGIWLTSMAIGEEDGYIRRQPNQGVQRFNFGNLQLEFRFGN